MSDLTSYVALRRGTSSAACLTSSRRGADFAGEAGGDEWLFPVEHELRARDAGFPPDADAP
jgi:hypothetical protein